MRIFIISLSILFFAFSGIITFRTLEPTVKYTRYQNTPKKLNSTDLSHKTENIKRQFTKKKADDKALIEELQAKIAMLEKKLSNKNIEAQAIIDSETEEHNISGNINTQMNKNQSKESFLYSRPNDKDKLNKKLNVDSQYASRLIYTIQIGSLINMTDAQKQFNSTLRLLNEKELDFLRIEKIGKNHIHTVRLGKFENYASAKKFLQDIKPTLSTAVILKAYIKNERIIKSYRNPKKQLTS